jgi:hypothetical protein
MTTPLPSIQRPYWKDHSRKHDEKLAKGLFFGMSTIDKKTGRWRYEYPSNEGQAFEALQRLLQFSCGDLDPDVLGGLLASLDRVGSFGRRLVFEKKRKRPAEAGAVEDFQIAIHIQAQHRRLGKMDAAVADAQAEFGISRKTAYQALKRTKEECPWFEF